MSDLYLKKLEETDKDKWLEFWEDFYKSGNMTEERWNEFQNTNWSGKLYYITDKENSVSQLNIYYLVEDEKMIDRVIGVITMKIQEKKLKTYKINVDDSLNKYNSRTVRNK